MWVLLCYDEMFKYSGIKSLNLSLLASLGRNLNFKMNHCNGVKREQNVKSIQ